MPTMSVESDMGNGELNLAAIPKNVPSLCIPRVFPNITSERVKAVFEQLGLGRVERVDVVVRTGEKGETLKRVFVHLEWNDSENAAKARQRLLCGNDIKVIYDEPWFWKISANRSTREPKREESRSQDSRREYQDRRDYQGSRPQHQDSRPHGQDRRDYQGSRPQVQDKRQDSRPPRQDSRPPRQDSRPPRQDSRPQDSRRDEYQDSRRQYYDSSRQDQEQRQEQRQEVQPQEQQQMIRQPKRRIVKRQHKNAEPQYVEMPRAEFAAAVERPMSPHSPPPRDEELDHTVQLLCVPRKANAVVEEEKERAEGEEKEI
uniref:RRM domain-containing protein n=1 Tax=viral metagenome TaxID=1070528 RepID=A0A6C0BBY2_9ZZZZ